MLHKTLSARGPCARIPGYCSVSSMRTPPSPRGSDSSALPRIVAGLTSRGAERIAGPGVARATRRSPAATGPTTFTRTRPLCLQTRGRRSHGPRVVASAREGEARGGAPDAHLPAEDLHRVPDDRREGEGGCYPVVAPGRGALSSGTLRGSSGSVV